MQDLPFLTDQTGKNIQIRLCAYLGHVFQMIGVDCLEGTGVCHDIAHGGITVEYPMLDQILCILRKLIKKRCIDRILVDIFEIDQLSHLSMHFCQMMFQISGGKLVFGQIDGKHLLQHTL